MKKIFTLTLLIFQSLFLFSQDIQIGGNIGIANYQGDVAAEQKWSAQEFNTALNIFLKKNLTSQITIRANFFLTKLKGKDSNHFDEASWRARRDFSFETPIQEFSILGEWQYWKYENERFSFQPYLLAGAGVLFFQPENIDAGVSFSIPVGGGFQLGFNDKISIGFEISSRKLFTDLIDGKSDDGFSMGNDSFANAGLSLLYNLKGKEEISK